MIARSRRPRSDVLFGALSDTLLGIALGVSLSMATISVVGATAIIYVLMQVPAR